MPDTPTPILFHPLLKPRVWGGRTLERYGKTLPAGQPIGESWELADLPESIPEGRSVIASPAALAGRTLHDVLADSTLRQAIMGDAPLTAEGGFPLLIKYLDAREDLSVQVHPSADYARRHPDAHVKSEAWVVIDADPGAVIYKGLRPGVTREEFARHIADNTVVDDLIAVPVQRGDCHYLPSGECHALGAGILVAEVQTPSDTTFRVYDWGRPASAGRQLHIEQALECIHFTSDHAAQNKPHRPHKPSQHGALAGRILTRTEYFEIEGVECIHGDSLAVDTAGRPQVWMMIEGAAVMRGAFTPAVELRSGMTMLVPAAAQHWRLDVIAPSWLLTVRLPSSAPQSAN